MWNNTEKIKTLYLVFGHLVLDVVELCVELIGLLMTNKEHYKTSLNNVYTCIGLAFQHGFRFRSCANEALQKYLF